MKSIFSCNGFYHVDLKNFTPLSTLPYDNSPANYMIICRPNILSIENHLPSDFFFEEDGRKYPIISIESAPKGIIELLRDGFVLKSHQDLLKSLCELKEFDRRNPQEWVENNLMIVYHVTSASECDNDFYFLTNKYRSISNFYRPENQAKNLQTAKEDNKEKTRYGHYDTNVVYSCGNYEYRSNSSNHKITSENKTTKPINNPVFAAIKHCYINYFNFSGRASRFEYWSFILYIVLLGVLMEYFILIADYPGTEGLALFFDMISVFLCIINFIPQLAVSWRRLHDIGESGWGTLWPIIMGVLVSLRFVVKGNFETAYIIGLLVGIIWQIYLFSRKGDPNPNKYGEPVK